MVLQVKSFDVKTKQRTNQSITKTSFVLNLVSLTNFNMVALMKAFNGRDVEVQVNIDELLSETVQK